MAKIARGTKRLDGKVFFNYRKNSKGVACEVWGTQERLDRMDEMRRIRIRRNADAVALYTKKLKEKHPERFRGYAKKYRDARKLRDPDGLALVEKKAFERLRADKARYSAMRRKAYEKRRQCYLKRLSGSVRTRMRHALKSGKNLKSLDYIGCSWECLAIYLEKMFKTGMTWDNYGKWHVDHVRPISSAKSLEALIPLLHYSNLQPLWAEENLSKWAHF